MGELPRDERGAFALLPLYVRALAGELMKLADKFGRIYVGSREPWEAIARMGGATTRDRRMLRKDVRALIDDGHLVLDGEHIVIRNMPKARARGTVKTTPSAPAETPQRDVAVPPVEREHDANTTRTRREPSTKSELSVRNCSVENGERSGEHPAELQRDPKSELSTRNQVAAPLADRLLFAGASDPDPEEIRRETLHAGEQEGEAPRDNLTLLADLSGDEDPPESCIVRQEPMTLPGMTPPPPRLKRKSRARDGVGVAKPRKNVVKSRLRAMEAMFSRGVTSHTGEPHAECWTAAPMDSPLWQITKVYADRRELGELDAWIVETARAFAASGSEESEKYGNAAKACLWWLNRGGHRARADPIAPLVKFAPRESPMVEYARGNS